MKLPLFYKAELQDNAANVELDEFTSKHIIQVLRMQAGEQLQLTNGRGISVIASISSDNRKKCVVTVQQKVDSLSPLSKISIAISPVKNNTRFEWFLEKATEIGVTEIIPLLCSRTEKQHFKWDRMNGILVSAMLQSQQLWLPLLREPVKFNDFVMTNAHQQKFIAHCEEAGQKKQLSQQVTAPPNEALILIGPEGDFTQQEITLALQQGYLPVALGNTRLRTETAAIVAAALLCNAY
jgi:16S rRNA (uracil1498-N3)-methyltransferase